MTAGLVRLHHEHRGPADAAPVVLTHGGADDSATWAAQVAHLEQRWHTTTWDLRGHGRSDAPLGDEHYGRDQALGDLLRMLEAAGVTPARPACLIGHSLGGYLSLAATILHPALVSHLVLVATGPGFRDPAARQRWNDGVASLAPRLGLRADVARLVQQPDSMVMERLAEIRCPTLVVVGGNDERYHAGSEHLARVLDAELLVVPGAGHHVHADYPDVVNPAIDRVLGA